MGFRRYLIRRILILIPLLIAILVAVFVVVRVLPADPIRVMLGHFVDQETINFVKASLNLDKPIHVQFLLYAKGLLRGNMGTSFTTGNPVTSDILKRLPATLELTTYTLLLATVFGIALGVGSALRAEKVQDFALRVISMLGIAIPNFWLGLVLIFVVFFLFRLVPAPIGRLDAGVLPPAQITGFYTIDSLLRLDLAAFRSAAAHLILPVTALGFGISAPIAKQTRSAMLEALSSEYVDYALLSGLSTRRVLWYALKNALLPVITIMGVLYGVMLGGAVLVERVFAWGGIGLYAVQVIQRADFPAIQGFVVTAAFFAAFVYFIVDVLYAAFDPRIKY